MHATRDNVQAVLLNLERVLGGLPINGVVKVHCRQVPLLAAPVTDVADLRKSYLWCPGISNAVRVTSLDCAAHLLSPVLTGAIMSETMINDTITIRPMVPLSSGIVVVELPPLALLAPAFTGAVDWRTTKHITRCQLT